MKRYLLTAAVLLFSFISDAQPAFDWVKQTDGEIFISAITTDYAGNFYAVGAFTGTVDFNPDPVVFDTLTDVGFGDIFIAKMDSAGHLLWVKHIGGTSYDEGKSITTDATGNVYVAGFFSTDSVDFDPGPGEFLMSASENSFVLKLDKNGDFAWAKQISGPGENYAVSIAVDQQKNIVLSGKFGGAADFDPNAGVSILNSVGIDIYICKLDSNSNFIWAKQIAGVTSATQCFSATTDVSGNVYVSGAFAGTIDFDPGAGVQNLTSTSLFSSAFILKLDAAGDFVWAKKLDNTDMHLYNGSIFADATGGLYVGGSFSGTVNFDLGGGVQELTATTANSHFLLKLGSDASFLWVKQLADIQSVGLDVNGDVYTCGTSTNKYSSSGTSQWEISNAASTRIAVDRTGNIYTTGTFTGTVDFDPGGGIMDLTSSGTSTFVLKMNQSIPSGINSAASVSGALMIYPNPGSDNVCIQSDVAGDYLLLTAAGQTVKTIDVKSGVPVMLDARLLPEGAYLIINRQRHEFYRQMIVAH
jgi:hypothetical protein